VLCDVPKIGVGREELQFVANAELGEDRVDGSYLDSPPPPAIANLRGFEVVVTIGRDERKSGEPGDDRLLCARPMEPLENLLVDESRRNNEFTVRQRSLEGAHLEEAGRWVAAQRQRPYAGVDEETQARERSCL